MTAILRLLLTVALLVVMAAPNAYAACSSPAGVAGRMTYTSNILYYCNDTAWVSMKGASISSCAGTTGGTVRYVAYNEGSPTTTGMHQLCDGTNWYSMRGTSLISSCLGEEGKLRYSSNQVQACSYIDGDLHWGDTAAPCAGATVGGYCWYAGGAAESCDTVCNLHGGCNSAGTVNYAGSGGTLAQCESVLVALGLGSGSATDWDQSIFDPIGVGCFMHHTGSRHRATPPTTTCNSGGIGGQQRACACAN